MLFRKLGDAWGARPFNSKIGEKGSEIADLARALWTMPLSCAGKSLKSLHRSWTKLEMSHGRCRIHFRAEKYH